jgi:predicted nuclease with RNAse H fold
VSGAGVGIDVGASRLHLVALAGDRRVLSAAVLPTTELADAVAFCVGVGPRRVAVDAPSGLSPSAHADDGTLAPKFRAARCGEIALGRDAGVWVPWVSPPIGAVDIAPWIAVGLALFDALADAGLEAVETYPHAVFRSLADGERVPAKSTAEGLRRRVQLLRAAGVEEPTLPMWGHDGLDAAAAALVAVDREPQVLTCGHDSSSIWLPA